MIQTVKIVGNLKGIKKSVKKKKKKEPDVFLNPGFFQKVLSKHSFLLEEGAWALSLDSISFKCNEKVQKTLYVTCNLVRSYDYLINHADLKVCCPLRTVAISAEKNECFQVNFQPKFLLITNPETFIELCFYEVNAIKTTKEKEDQERDGEEKVLCKNDVVVCALIDIKKLP